MTYRSVALWCRAIAEELRRAGTEFVALCPGSRNSPLLFALAEVFRRAATSKVEIACAGGTGRTGSALAILARLSGVPSGDAIAWVRANYRPRAVETFRQRRWVERTPI